MSTNDTPGSNPANNDKLAAGCWAEHEDGSMILVEGTEGDLVVFTTFDLAANPPVEYRMLPGMDTDEFANMFSCNPTELSKRRFRAKGSDKTVEGEKDVWTWHDKSPFPWDRVAKAGIGSGTKAISLAHMREAVEHAESSAAARVREALRLEAQPLRDASHMEDAIRDLVLGVTGVIKSAIDRMRQ